MKKNKKAFFFLLERDDVQARERRSSCGILSSSSASLFASLSLRSAGLVRAFRQSATRGGWNERSRARSGPAEERTRGRAREQSRAGAALVGCDAPQATGLPATQSSVEETKKIPSPSCPCPGRRPGRRRRRSGRRAGGPWSAWRRWRREHLERFYMIERAKREGEKQKKGESGGRERRSTPSIQSPRPPVCAGRGSRPPR